MDISAKLPIFFWAALLMLYIWTWIKNRLKKPHGYSDLIGFASAPIVISLFVFALFLNNSSEITTCPFLNHLNESPYDTGSYSLITAFIGVLFGVGVPVGFQVITSFGERYSNAYLSKLVFDAIKTDLIFYVSYTLMTIFAGILFSYLKISSSLAFLEIIILGILSFYYAVNIITIIFRTVVDSESFANKLVREKTKEIQNNDVHNEEKLRELIKLAGVNYDLLLFQLRKGNFINFEEELTVYLDDFSDFVELYENDSRNIRSFLNNKDKINKEIFKVRAQILRDILIKTNADKLFSEIEVIGFFYGSFVKDTKNEKEMFRFIYTIDHVYSRYLEKYTGSDWNDKFIIMVNWATFYYFYEDVVISEKSKNYLLSLISYKADRFFINNPDIEYVKKFIEEILRRCSGISRNNCVYNIIEESGYIENDEINIEDIDKIYNSETFALYPNKYNELKGKLDSISRVQKNEDIKKEINKYLDSAYEQHKRYLMGCLLFNVIAKCISKNKNEYVKEILNSHDEYAKRGYKRLLPSNSKEARMMSTTCVELDSEDLFREDEYDYEAVEKLFSGTDAEHQMF